MAAKTMKFLMMRFVDRTDEGWSLTRAERFLLENVFAGAAS